MLICPYGASELCFLLRVKFLKVNLKRPSAHELQSLCFTYKEIYERVETPHKNDFYRGFSNCGPCSVKTFLCLNAYLILEAKPDQTANHRISKKFMESQLSLGYPPPLQVLRVLYLVMPFK